ncbi:OmpH family outer membrane protein [Methylogaea oryzae]|uniref:Outer membrane protein chaperone n=2 Tax=Methylogaea oryzae TaxID=1295382 RepID=A0A8D4VP22_9GAMM|nr:outer membrane protein chaperone [Methylogaea oryzae]
MTTKRAALLFMGLFMATTAMAGDLKIGFVNVPKLLEKAPQAEKAKKELEREFSPRDKRLVSEQKEIKQLEEKLSKDGAVMSDGERQKLEKEVMNRKREGKRLQDEFREDFNIRRNEELGKLQREVFEAIQALAKEESFDLLLTDGVVFASEQIDVTEKVSKKLLSGTPAK